MTEHAAGIVYRWPESVRAHCDCGWEGPPRDWTKEAVADARQHEGDAEGVRDDH